jgi:hypothetical protein
LDEAVVEFGFGVDEDEAGAGGVVADAYTGGGQALWFGRGLLRWLVEGDRARDRFEYGGGDGAGTVEDDRGLVRGGTQADDGGFEADGGGAAVEDGVDAMVEVLEDVLCGGGAGAAKAVGAGGSDGDAGGFDEGEGDGVGGHADAYEGAAGGDVVGDVVRAGEQKG